MTETDVDHLHACFPQILKATIRSHLRACNGDVDQAADILLSLKQSPKVQRPKSRLHSRVGERHSKGSGWAAVSSQARKDDNQFGNAVTYIDERGSKQAPNLASDYPDLQASNGGWSESRSIASSSATRSATPASSRHSSWLSGSSGEVSPYKSKPLPIQPEILAADLSRRLSFEAQRPAYSMVVGDGKHTATDMDQQLAKLAAGFPEMDLDIIKETYVAANSDDGLAKELLSNFISQPAKADPSAVSYKTQHPQKPSIGNNVPARDDSDWDSEEYSLHMKANRSKSRLKTKGSGPKSRTPRGSHSASRAGGSGKAVPVQDTRETVKASNRSPGAKVGNLSESSSEDEIATSAIKELSYADDTSDTYHKYRAKALRLDRKRFRRLKNAAQLYALGQHSSAHAALKEAKNLKAEAEMAHREAARQIEEANNAGKDQWELDLHGLHLQEANNALDTRLRSLEQLKLPPDDKRLLRTIVGRGNHSTGGEAILQRSVQSHLLRQNYKIEMRGGSILIHPKKGRRK